MSSCHLFFFGPFRGVMDGGSGVSIGGVRILTEEYYLDIFSIICYVYIRGCL